MFYVNHIERTLAVYWFSDWQIRVPNHRSLGGENVNLLFISDVLNLLLKTNREKQNA